MYLFNKFNKLDSQKLFISNEIVFFFSIFKIPSIAKIFLTNMYHKFRAKLVKNLKHVFIS